MASVTVDASQFRDFFARMGNASEAFRKELGTFLDGVGNEFLRVVQDEIIDRKVMDSRLLLNSFEKGKGDNIWQLKEDGMVLEVGTGVNYAGFVNDGHWTNPEGVAVRFVPGYWRGYRFIYDPNASTGMVLKQHWVEGAHYFDAGLRIMEKMFPKFLENKLAGWITKYFGD